MSRGVHMSVHGIIARDDIPVMLQGADDYGHPCRHLGVHLASIDAFCLARRHAQSWPPEK